jgi:hypothetical protein
VNAQLSLGWMGDGSDGAFACRNAPYKILKPNGHLVITDWCDDYLTCRVCDIFLRLFNRAHSRTHGTSECQRMLQDEGLAKISIEKHKIDWLWGMMTATAVKEADIY